MEISFLNPKYLWLLVSIPMLILVHLFSLKFLRTRAWIFSNYEAIKRVSGVEQTMRNSIIIRKNFWLLATEILVVGMVILSAADPIYFYVGKSSQKSYVIAIDASASMLADDFSPNRLEAAKNAAFQFLDKLPDKTSVGIVTFSGTSFVESPMTESMNDLKDTIKKIDIKNVGGTDIAGAIITSANIMSKEQRSKTIILLTDGRSTVGAPIEEGINAAIDKGIVIHTIGMATEKGGSYIKSDIISTIDNTTMTVILNALNTIKPESGYRPDLNNLKFYKSTGCDKCQNIGYKGRIGIFEILLMNQKIEKLILADQASEYEIEKIAVADGMINLFQDGLLKALDGITSISEIMDRVKD